MQLLAYIVFVVLGLMFIGSFIGCWVTHCKDTNGWRLDDND